MDSIMNVAEVQLSYISNVKSSARYKINSSQDAYELLVKYFPDDTIGYRESFKVILLNQPNRVLGIVPISEGGISATYVDVRLILQAALLANATQIILAHNHPSGSLKPSTLDDTLTERVITLIMMKVNYKSLQIKPSNNLLISTNTPSLPFLSIMMGNNISLTLLVVYINGVSEMSYVFTSNSYL